MSALNYLRTLQADPKTKNGYHHGLRVWVDDASSIARVLGAMDHLGDTRQPKPEPTESESA